MTKTAKKARNWWAVPDTGSCYLEAFSHSSQPQENLQRVQQFLHSDPCCALLSSSSEINAIIPLESQASSPSPHSQL